MSIRKISSSKVAKQKTLDLLSARAARNKSLGKANVADIAELKRVNDD